MSVQAGSPLAVGAGQTGKRLLVHGVGAPKLPRTMARKKFLKILRLMRYVREANLRAVFHCPRCEQPAVLKRGETGLIDTVGVQAPIDERIDAFSIVCGCTIWAVRQ
jgi:hypothetical protein